MTDTEVKPFFINSNICVDEGDISSLENYLSSLAFNIGNSYPTWSLIKQLQGGFVKPHHIQNIWKYDFSKQDKDIDIINNECTHVFLILQDQIRIQEGYNQVLPYDNIINFIKRVKKPVIVGSLGANSYNDFDSSTGFFKIQDNFDPNFHKALRPELVTFLKELSELTEVIGIRGYYTQEILSKLDINNTQVIGCMSFYEMGRNRIINKKDFSSNLKVLFENPGNPFNGYKMTPIQQKYNYPAMIQDENKYFNLLFKGIFNLGDFNQTELNNFIKRQYYCFSDIESWKQCFSEYDFIFGFRIHGSILALNSGVPSMIMTLDLKGKEMAEFMKIPNHPELINETDIEKIYNACNYDEMNKCYPELYDNYVSFLHKNKVTLFEENPTQKYEYTQQPKLEVYKNDSIPGVINTNILLKLKTETDTRVGRIEETLKRHEETLRNQVETLKHQNEASIKLEENLKRQEEANVRIEEILKHQGEVLKCQEEALKKQEELIRCHEEDKLQHQEEILNRQKSVDLKLNELVCNQNLILKKLYRPSFLHKFFYICDRVNNRIARQLGIRKIDKR